MLDFAETALTDVSAVQGREMLSCIYLQSITVHLRQHASLPKTGLGKLSLGNMQLIIGFYEHCPEENEFASRSMLVSILKNYLLSLCATIFLIV